LEEHVFHGCSRSSVPICQGFIEIGFTIEHIHKVLNIVHTPILNGAIFTPWVLIYFIIDSEPEIITISWKACDRHSTGASTAKEH
jgi:hypothetical protein